MNKEVKDILSIKDENLLFWSRQRPLAMQPRIVEI
jgi:hypothetical protein